MKHETTFVGLLHYIRSNPEQHLDFGTNGRPLVRVTWMKTAGGWQWAVRPMVSGHAGGSGRYSPDEHQTFLNATKEVEFATKPLPIQFAKHLTREDPVWSLSVVPTEVRQMPGVQDFDDGAGDTAYVL